MAEEPDDSFNASRAEIFEALSHSTRIGILQILKEKSLTFSELKRAAGLESNGLLTFHLGKLKDLVRLNSEGAYALTDEGREALRIVEATKKYSEDGSFRWPFIRVPHLRTIFTGLVVVLAAIVGLAATALSFLVSTISNFTFNLTTGGTYVVFGFPIPYINFPEGGSPQCTFENLPSLACSFTFQPAYALGDFLIWSSISFLIIYSFTTRRPPFALIGFAFCASLIVTLATFLVPPLQVVARIPSIDSFTALRQAGFPWSYFISGQGFILTSAFADYVLWTGVTLAVVGIINTFVHRKH
jgi:DNA-binding transcriptional ArsR family regulator